MSLGRAYPEVDTLPSACMRPVAYKPKRLNLHANEATILNLHAKVVVSPVSCQVVTADPRQALGRLLLVDCLLGTVRLAGTRTQPAARTPCTCVQSMRTRFQAPNAHNTCMRFPCFRTYYCCMHVAEYSFLHPLALLAGHLTRDLPCRLTRHCNIRAHPLTHCFRSLSHAISRDMLATRLSVDCVLRNLCAPSSQCGCREPLPNVVCTVKPNGLD